MFAVMLLVTFFGVAGMGYDAMIPAYTRRVVQTGVEGYSLLLACGGIGATLGAFTVATLSAMRRKDRWVTGGMIVFGVFLAAAAMLPLWAQPIWSIRARLAAASICLLGTGFGGVVFYASALTLIQLSSPDHLRGRMMGIWMIVFSGSVPLGALWTGLAARFWGVGAVMVVSALACIFAGVLVLASGVLAPRYPVSQAAEPHE
jgi:MFS family permease